MLTLRYDLLPWSETTRVLDLGCGHGRHSYEVLRRGGDVVAVDVGDDEVTAVQTMMGAMALEREYDGTRQLGAALRGDGRSLPFADETFDIVLLSEVLEHIPDDAAVLGDVARVVRPGGTVVVTVPRAWPERINWWLSDEYHNVPGGHIRIYRRRTLEARMRQAGFVVRARHHAHGLHTPYWWLKCAVGTTNDDHWLVRQYHRLLVWDIMKRPRTTRWVEALLNPAMGKSLVLYATKTA